MDSLNPLPQSTPARKKAHPFSSLTPVWIAVIIVAVLYMANTRAVPPNDFWWHMKAGETLATTGHIPTVDTYSHIAEGHPYPSYATFWLADLLFYFLYRAGGVPLVIFGNAIAITLAYTLLLLICYRLSLRWPVAAFATLYGILLGFTNWNVRPQGFAYPLAMALLGCLYAYQHTRRIRWLLPIPLILLVWANLHGSWTLGLLMLGIWLIDVAWQAFRQHGFARPAISALRWPALATLLSALAVLINPKGIGIITYVVMMARDPASQTLGTEWVSPTLDDPLGVIFLVGLLLTAVLFAVSPRRPAVAQILTFLAFGLLGLQMIRASVWFGYTLAPIVALHLGSLFGPRAAQQKRRVARWQAPVNGTLFVVILLLGVFSLPWLKHLLPLPEFRREFLTDTPVKAVEVLLAERPPAPLFNENGFGSYLIWAASPTYKVFVDPRLELYSVETWEEYIRISAAECGWEDKLASYGIQTLLLSPSWQPELVKAATSSPAWRTLYQDDVAVLLTRH